MTNLCLHVSITPKPSLSSVKKNYESLSALQYQGVNKLPSVFPSVVYF